MHLHSGSLFAPPAAYIDAATRLTIAIRRLCRFVEFPLPICLPFPFGGDWQVCPGIPALPVAMRCYAGAGAPLPELAGQAGSAQRLQLQPASAHCTDVGVVRCIVARCDDAGQPQSRHWAVGEMPAHRDDTATVRRVAPDRMLRLVTISPPLPCLPIVPERAEYGRCPVLAQGCSHAGRPGTDRLQ